MSSNSPLTLLFIFLLTTSYAVAQNSTGSPYPYGYARVSPSMAIIIVVLITAIFITGFFSIYIRHCSDSTSSTSHRPGTTSGRSRPNAARGLDPEVIATFPTLVYSTVKGLKIGKRVLECAVCLNEFEDDETLRLLPKCDHVFHPECIDAWLASHVTCPVCRANLTPRPGDSPIQLTELPPELDLEAQNAAVELEQGNSNDVVQASSPPHQPQPVLLAVDGTLNRNRTRGSRSGRPLKFHRSHSTGHSLIQPGEDIERFTLRLPVDVRNRIMNQRLNRTRSMVELPGEGSSRRGNRTGGEGGSSRGKFFSFNKRLDRLDQAAKSGRLAFTKSPSFLARASSFLTRVSSSVRSPRVTTNNDREGTSVKSGGPDTAEPSPSTV